MFLFNLFCKERRRPARGPGIPSFVPDRPGMMGNIGAPPRLLVNALAAPCALSADYLPWPDNYLFGNENYANSVMRIRRRYAFRPGWNYNNLISTAAFGLLAGHALVRAARRCRKQPPLRQRSSVTSPGRCDAARRDAGRRRPGVSPWTCQRG